MNRSLFCAGLSLFVFAGMTAAVSPAPLLDSIFVSRAMAQEPQSGGKETQQTGDARTESGRTDSGRTKGRDAQRQPGEKRLSDEEAVSGPQAGEKLGKIPVQIVPQGKPADILKTPSEKAELRSKHSEGPLLLIFMNEKSRPGFALTRLLSEYTHRLGKEKAPPTYFIMLTEDASGTDKWLRGIAKHLKPSVRLAVAEGGIEGPGSLGLNRLVAMTVLVCDDSKVVDNYSLVQPSAQVDGAKMIQSIAKVVGDEKPPRVRQLMPRGR